MLSPPVDVDPFAGYSICTVNTCTFSMAFYGQGIDIELISDDKFFSFISTPIKLNSSYLIVSL